MNLAPHQVGKGIIHKAVTRHSRLTRECGTDEGHPIVTATSGRTGVPGMEGAFVLDRQFKRRQHREPLAHDRHRVFSHP
jgi:hypothetical protein